MCKMYRITLQKMLVLLRLVTVMSLAGYSLPTASAAMHGSLSGSDMVHSHDHQVQADDHHAEASGDHSHGDHASSQDDAAKKNLKQECCSSFCVGVAIVTATVAVGGPQTASIREFIDDARPLGELPPLHRPPNI
ncbi:hypothetical protein GHK48_08325 [Sinorhizobium fredii]|uniref:DUF2946 domain-containing protein n=2 Tax=Rhizobium fredii TaxID=380 RepID=A0A844A5D0_RHIFR|nr:hypothetical protein [Sinorhizobium fredii]GEC32862.1 hypothetical protein EFR01_30330 [Sinorhizobium fredii]GLS07013.1 hypothetical protein GCM10007864_06390 [Sinorhizobium fredii]